jgi:hypothetical protein
VAPLADNRMMVIFAGAGKGRFRQTN